MSEKTILNDNFISDNADLISVIVPVYNAENYVGQCIKSILDQSYTNFELILINDGSKDRSLEVCQNYVLRDERIRVYDRENGGASAARNVGLQNATGDYIVFVDSDDFVSKNYLENLYLAANSCGGGYDIVQCNLKSVDSRDGEIMSVPFRNEHVQEITKAQALNDRYYKVSVWGKIYSSKIFINFQFEEGIIYEDDASYYIFVDRADKIAILNETLYFYFMSDNSVMRNEDKETKMDFVGIYEKRIQYFIEKNNQELLDGSYGRYCLVLMLFLTSARGKKHNQKDIPFAWKTYKECYSKAWRSKYLSFPDKCMYTCYRFFPKASGFFIQRLRS